MTNTETDSFGFGGGNATTGGGNAATGGGNVVTSGGRAANPTSPFGGSRPQQPGPNAPRTGVGIIDYVGNGVYGALSGSRNLIEMARRRGAEESDRELADRLSRDEALRRQAVAEAPEDPQLARVVAAALNRAERPQEAAQVVDAALQNFPEDPGLLEMRKLFAKKIDDKAPVSTTKKAADFLKSLIGKGPEASVNGAAVAYQSTLRKAPAGADPQLASLGGVSAGRAAPYALPAAKLGANQMGLDPRAAEASFTKAIREDPKNWAAWGMRSLARRKLGDPEGAYADANEALKLNPSYGWSYKARALAAIDLGRWPQAEADLSLALQLAQGKDADAYRTRALLWERQGQPEKMLADLKRAAALDPAFEALYREALGSSRKDVPLPRRWPFVSTGLALLMLAFLAYRLLGKEAITTALARARAPASAEDGIVGFQIVRQVGQGGMGVVYEAVDRALDRRVALKKMRPEISADPRERRRFLKEARLVAALKHPNIIEIHTVIEHGPDLYLVFEYVDGEPLSALLERRGALSPREALSFLKPMAAALDYAHSMGIVHQDLKPSNVLIAKDQVKVMDFGIARRLQETLSTVSRQEVVGTPAYMAPEQAVGSPLPASDVYALGLCAYQMLAGSLPLPGRGVNGASGSWEPALERALEQDPDKRFPSAGALVLALEALS